KTLQYHQELFVTSLPEALTDAFDYQYSAGRFDIADKISLLLSQLTTAKNATFPTVVQTPLH
ncbi:MAG TPA: hypothetical protein VK893_00040, partial [Pyrinomonadaceae bacterium]|nr:hypothetical protein [Pyrinomonadaceae bacterium]